MNGSEIFLERYRISRLVAMISVWKEKVKNKPLSLNYKICALINAYFRHDKAYNCGYWLRHNRQSSGPIYYIIRQPMRSAACVLKTYIYQYSWAKKNGLIPVMDQEPISVYSKKEIGIIDNLWELAFEQEISIEEALKQDNVFVSELSGGPKDKDLMRMIPTVGENYSGCPKDIQELEQYRKYRPFDLRLSEKIIENAELFCEKHQFGKKRVLAVYMREQFSLGHYIPREEYEGTVLALHPLMPTIEGCISFVKETIGKYKFDAIFLASECEDTIQAFKKTFCDVEILYIPRRRKSLKQMISSLKEPGDYSLFPVSYLKEQFDYLEEIPDYDNFKEKNSKYMQEICIITKCNSLIASPSNAIVSVAMIKKDSFDYYHVFPYEHNNY